jgi:hypothetical protein
MFGVMSPQARNIVSSVFDLADSEMTLNRAYSYLTYMSDRYMAAVEETRAPSMDLFEKFKTDLERVRSQTAPPIFSAPPAAAPAGSIGGSSARQSRALEGSSVDSAVFADESGRMTTV